MEREHLEAEATALFGELIQKALKDLRAGTMKAADMEVARKLVRDAGIRYTPSAPTTENQIVRRLPFALVEEEAEDQNR